MGLDAGSPVLVACLCLCFVQCQWVSFVDNFGDLNNVSTNTFTTSRSDWSPHGEDLHPGSIQLQPTSLALSQSENWLRSNSQYNHNGTRSRRQSYYSSNTNNILVPAYSWRHKFSTTVVHSNSKESAYVWEENTKRLTHTLEKDTSFELLNPNGLRISIPADNINIRIVDIRFKLNEDFRGNEGGHYTPTSYKRGGLWTYEIPQLKVKQGDKLYYQMNVKFIKEGTDITVKGVIDITLGNPPIGGAVPEPIPFRPMTSAVLRPQPQPQSPYGGGGLGGGTRGAFGWNHSFTINPTQSNGFTQSSVNSWQQQLNLLQNSLENSKFEFSNPTGLTVSIPDNNIIMRIEDFRLKLNEDFRGDDGGHYAATSNQRGSFQTYNIPQIRAQQGDKIYYWLQVKIGREGFDATVRGVLHITLGDPHAGGPSLVLPVPDYVAPNKPTNQYPTQRPTYQYPTQPPYTTRPPTNQYPTQRPTYQYPTQPPYTTRPPTNQYPTQRPTYQYPTQPPYTTRPPTFQYTTQPPQYQPIQPDFSQPSQPNQPCSQPSVSTRNGEDTPPCQGELLLDHKFDTKNGWTHQISIGGNNLEDEFTCFVKDDENVWIQQGKLYIQPTLLEDKSNDSFVRSGELILEGCTSTVSKHCHRKAQTFVILPPINSARISTKGTFTFRYGTVEIRAKLPRGDWIVPELWLEPKNPDVGEKIVVGVAKGNTGNIGNQLGAGIIRAKDTRLSLMNMIGSTPWYQGFHTFKLEWTPEYVRFLVDDREVHYLSSGTFPVLSKEVYITLGVHVGGNRDFPDDSFPEKPWKSSDIKRVYRFWSAKEEWYPTWKNDRALQVDYIRVTAL